MKRIAPGIIGVLLTLSAAAAFAQGKQPPTLATDITAADVQTVIKAPTAIFTISPSAGSGFAP